MIVMAALSGPYTQSLSPTGGNMDCSVGPGVGRGLITVQPAGTLASSLSVWVGVAGISVRRGDSVAVAGLSVLVASLMISAPGVCFLELPWQLVRMRAESSNINSIRFKRIFLVDILDQERNPDELIQQV